jgi:hypothetical protein
MSQFEHSMWSHQCRSGTAEVAPPLNARSLPVPPTSEFARSMRQEGPLIGWPHSWNQLHFRLLAWGVAVNDHEKKLLPHDHSDSFGCLAYVP